MRMLGFVSLRYFCLKYWKLLRFNSVSCFFVICVWFCKFVVAEALCRETRGLELNPRIISSLYVVSINPNFSVW